MSSGISQKVKCQFASNLIWRTNLTSYFFNFPRRFLKPTKILSSLALIENRLNFCRPVCSSSSNSSNINNLHGKEPCARYKSESSFQHPPVLSRTPSGLVCKYYSSRCSFPRLRTSPPSIQSLSITYDSIHLSSIFRMQSVFCAIYPRV